MQTIDRVHFGENFKIPHRRKNAKIMVTLFLLILFSGYFFYQASDAFFGPNLVLASPKDGELIDGFVEINGVTEPNLRLTANEYEFFSNEEGMFDLKLPFVSGFHILEVVATNRLGKKARIVRAITVK